MSNHIAIEVCGVPLKRKPLAKLRLKARRCRVWFSSLRENQRKLMDLVITVVEPFSSISFPTPLIKEIEKVVEELGYWPNKTAFIREAVMEKMERYKRELEAKRCVAEEIERTTKA